EDILRRRDRRVGVAVVVPGCKSVPGSIDGKEGGAASHARVIELGVTPSGRGLVVPNGLVDDLIRGARAGREVGVRDRHVAGRVHRYAPAVRGNGDPVDLDLARPAGAGDVPVDVDVGHPGRVGHGPDNGRVSVAGGDGRTRIVVGGVHAPADLRRGAPAGHMVVDSRPDVVARVPLDPGGYSVSLSVHRHAGVEGEEAGRFDVEGHQPAKGGIESRCVNVEVTPVVLVPRG